MAFYCDRYREWKGANYAERASVSLRHYALGEIHELDPNEWDDEDDFRVHVYALGKLAGKPMKDLK